MKFLFRKKEPIATSDNKTANAIASLISHMQTMWVRAMESWSGKLSRRGQGYAFSLFLLVGAAYSAFCIGKVFIGSPKVSLEMDELQKPRLQGQDQKPIRIISDREFLKIQKFKIYLDSLARSPGGKKIRDSLIRSHPGLIDSIAAVEEIYRRQHQILILKNK